MDLNHDVSGVNLVRIMLRVLGLALCKLMELFFLYTCKRKLKVYKYVCICYCAFCVEKRDAYAISHAIVMQAISFHA